VVALIAVGRIPYLFNMYWIDGTGLTSVSGEDLDVDGYFGSGVEVGHDDWFECLSYSCADLQ